MCVLTTSERGRGERKKEGTTWLRKSYHGGPKATKNKVPPGVLKVSERIFVTFEVPHTVA